MTARRSITKPSSGPTGRLISSTRCRDRAPLGDAQRTTAITAETAPDWLAGQVIRVRSAWMTVGRGQTDVYLDDPPLNRVHAALIARDKQLAVEDLGSRSGTTVNGVRVHTRQPLRMGDLVGFGPVDGFVDSDAAGPRLRPLDNRRFHCPSTPVVSIFGS
jgi:pSer/pThr/pTyr-binding forkhead associated (FHA) protein